MKKMLKMVFSAALAFGVLFTSSVVSFANEGGPVFEIPKVESSHVVSSYKRVNVKNHVDMYGINFSNYQNLDAYKVVRDRLFVDDLDMAKDYWELLDNDIMPILNKEYMRDIYKAKVYYGHISLLDGSGLNFSNYKNLDAYKVVRDSFLEDDLKMARDYWKILSKNILPILEKEYEKDLSLAREYYKAKSLLAF